MTLDEALVRASEENGLAEYYRDIVRPLIRDNLHAAEGEGRWPRCCGGGCEPCAEQLIRVAKRTLELMKSE